MFTSNILPKFRKSLQLNAAKQPKANEGRRLAQIEDDVPNSVQKFLRTKHISGLLDKTSCNDCRERSAGGTTDSFPRGRMGFSSVQSWPADSMHQSAESMGEANK